MCSIMCMYVCGGKGCMLNEKIYVERLGCWVLKKCFVHIFLNTFQNEVNSFLEEREERYWCSKNGPLVIICFEES